MTKLTIDGYQNKENNKYFKIYKSLIEKRLLYPVEIGTYCETHHILPKSIGGDNSKDNLIKLSAREHYIAHLLLTKFIFGKDRFKVLNAFFCMNMKSKNTLNRYQNSKLYESLKIELSNLKSEYYKKLWDDEEYKNKMREKAKISWYDGSREKQIEYMKNNSPFKIKKIHEKTMKKRKYNGSNPFVNNNPMYNEEAKRKKIEKTSGKNHYLTKKNNYEYSKDNGITWIDIDGDLTVFEICQKMDWNVSTFNYILNGKIPKRGNMKGLIIRKLKIENT